MIRGAVAIVGLASLVAAGEAQAQVRPARPVAPTAADTTKGRDTTAKWLPADSVMESLLKKAGYTITRYEGAVVTFNALDKAFAIAAAAANKAVVEREGQRVVTDSVIVYNDQTRSVTVSGNFEIAPGAGQAPIAGSSTAQYNLAERSGRIANARVTVEESGQRWFIHSEIGKTALGDSSRGIAPRFYGLGGSLTSCEDSIPDYHFELKEIKRTEKTLVARPAVLYIRDIPVMWLPFVFQDIRAGRRSGILPPRFGASDIVRNNPGYRRHIENLGYYWAFSDYADVTMWVDWRSSAGADSLDPGWMQFNTDWNYNWLTRFLSGRIAGNYMQQHDGQSKYSVSWNHDQFLGRNRRIITNVNYTSDTRLQQRNTFNPYQTLATIYSTFSYSDKLGPASLQLGGNRRQSPGRDQIDQTLPSLSINTAPINLAPWLVWTPAFRFEESARLHIDQPDALSTHYVGDPNGQAVRSDTLDRNYFARTVSFNTPLRVFGMDFSNGITIRDQLKDYPEEKEVLPDADSARKELRVFRRTYRTDVDWNPSFSLPPFFQNRFKLTPSVTLGNVDPNPFWVRTELSGGRFVQQSKRLSYGLSAGPTIFGIWPGFGPFQRFRHALSPTIAYQFAPRARVSNEFLAATGQRRQGYLGSLPVSAVSFSLSQLIEAKVRSSLDTSPAGEAGQKLKVLSMQFTPVSYDFERARATKRRISGLTTENVGATLRSDLIPGFDVGVDYSLFQGTTQSDTAVFKPFLTRVASTLRFSQTENPMTVISRLFGRAVPDQNPTPQRNANQTPQEEAMSRQARSQPIAGQAARGSQFVVPPSKGWEATFSFSTTRSRPPTGDRVDQFDPRVRCEVYRLINLFTYEECLRQPINNELIPSTTAGARYIQLPRQTSLTSAMNFELTQKWAASWQTSYDFEQRQFASHVVSLQRDLHDWRAVFAFTHSPNGNFAFNFFIALKPQPDLKFDYARASVRGR